MFYTLLKIDALVQVSTEKGHLKEYPADMDEGHVEDHIVQDVIWFIQHRIVVEIDHYQRDLMEQYFLTKRNVEVVCLDVTERCQTRES